VNVFTHWKKRIFDAERSDFAAALARAAAFVVSVSIFVLAGVFDGTVVVKVKEHMLQHSEEDGILLKPPLGIGSGDLLSSLRNDIVSQTLGELLHAIFNDSESSRLP
jgi:hypothetical protein